MEYTNFINYIQLQCNLKLYARITNFCQKFNNEMLIKKKNCKILIFLNESKDN